MKILREPPIRIEAYLFAIAAAVVAWIFSVSGIRHEVNRLKDVADRLEKITFDSGASINIDGQEQHQVVFVMSPEVVQEFLRDERIRMRMVADRENSDAMQ